MGVQSGGGADADGCVSSKRRIQNNSVSVTTNYVSGLVGRVGLGFGVTLDLRCRGNEPHHALWMFIEIQHQLPDDGWGSITCVNVHMLTAWVHVENMCDFVDVSEDVNGVLLVILTPGRGAVTLLFSVWYFDDDHRSIHVCLLLHVVQPTDFC